ncbi:solute carrier family 25 member 45-like [Glandiceps talaboti]
MVWADFVAGFLGGGAGLFVGHPFDTIKVRLQAQSISGTNYGGIIDCTRKLIGHESILGFYKGMGFPLATIPLQNAITFGAYGYALKHLSLWKYGTTDCVPGNMDIVIAGCVGGFAQLSVACPVELVKIRLQMQTHGKGNPSSSKVLPHYRGPVHCISSIWKTEGLPGCYRGLNIMIFRDIPASAVYFLTYEVLCKKLTSEGKQGPSTLAMLLAGGLAGCASWIIINPMDVIKSRYQADGVKTKMYRNIWHCCVDSYRTGGFRVFLTGLSINCIRGFPVNAVTFTVYSLSLQAFTGQKKRTETT